MTTYYDYLRDRVLASAATNQAQPEHLIHAERNAFWQQICMNTGYDEHARMGALAAFDEQASRILSEHAGRFGRPQPAPVEPAAAISHHGGGAVAHGGVRERLPARSRALSRDLFFLLVGLVLGVMLGVAAAYFGRAVLVGSAASAGGGGALGITGLTASKSSFKFVRSNPSEPEGEIEVAYADGAPRGLTCTVEASYRQVLEYVKFDSGCRKVSFKFLPAADLWANWNYLEGYMVFSTTISSASGGHWEGSASVYFSVNGTT